MGAENLPLEVITRIGRELNALTRKPIAGVRLIPHASENLTEIHAEIDGPDDTPYRGGTFHVKLVLGQEYPDSPPRGFFLTKIFHPNVSSSGDICVNTLKKDWSSTVNLSHILQVLKCLLIVPFPESSLNSEAGKLFMDSYKDYARRAQLMTSVHAVRKIAPTGASIRRISSGLAPLEDNNQEKIRAGEFETPQQGSQLNAGFDVNKAGSGDNRAIATHSAGPNSTSSPGTSPPLVKRKLHPNQKDVQADKRCKDSRRRGLKRL